jgi:predicted nucleic acid-binding protein
VITVDERDRVLSRFFQDCDEHFTLISMERALIDRAVELTQRHRLRAYDAPQLATALEVNALMQARGLPTLTFVAADNDLINAATAEHVAVENPLNHTQLDT